jgi:hypothetical protein
MGSIILREIKDWRKRPEGHALTPSKLMSILRGIYPEEVAEDLFEELTKDESGESDRTQEGTS